RPRRPRGRRRPVLHRRRARGRRRGAARPARRRSPEGLPVTGSQWLDLALFALAAAAAISKWINGAAASGFALLGVGIGATSGLLVAPHLVREFDSPLGRLAAGLAVIAVMVIIGQIAGVTIGRAARRYISGSRARRLDRTVGAG